MSEIQRYITHDDEQIECPEGEYVLHDDHLAEVQRLREQVRVLREAALNAADALARAYAGMIQDADVQNLVGIRAALAQTAPGEQR